MVYASKIKIDYTPQKIKYQREVELPDRLLSVEDISKHIKEGESFTFFEKKECFFDSPTYLSIIGFRDETVKEVKDRVKKQEKYNKEYEAFNEKYRKR